MSFPERFHRVLRIGCRLFGFVVLIVAFMAIPAYGEASGLHSGGVHILSFSSGLSGKIGPGMYKVGVDIQAGTYRLYQASDFDGYWKRSLDASGETESIIANDLFENKAYVTVWYGEYLTLENCYGVLDEAGYEDNGSQPRSDSTPKPEPTLKPTSGPEPTPEATVSPGDREQAMQTLVSLGWVADGASKQEISDALLQFQQAAMDTGNFPDVQVNGTLDAATVACLLSGSAPAAPAAP